MRLPRETLVATVAADLSVTPWIMPRMRDFAYRLHSVFLPISAGIGGDYTRLEIRNGAADVLARYDAPFQDGSETAVQWSPAGVGHTAISGVGGDYAQTAQVEIPADLVITPEMEVRISTSGATPAGISPVVVVFERLPGILNRD